MVLIEPELSARDAALRALQALGAEAIAFGCARDFFNVVVVPGPGCAVVDSGLPDMTATQFQAELLRRGLHTPVLFLVGRDDVELAVSLMKGGAADVLLKSEDWADMQRRTGAVLAARARADAQATSARERLSRLTQRELEVVMLATTGLSNKDIADHFKISFRTVEVHRRNAMRKTSTNNVVELTHLVGSAWRGEAATPEASTRGGGLTEREREVMQLGSSGLSVKDIADRLAISARTVEAHRGNAQRKSESGASSAPAEGTADQLSLWSTG